MFSTAKPDKVEADLLWSYNHQRHYAVQAGILIKMTQHIVKGQSVLLGDITCTLNSLFIFLISLLFQKNFGFTEQLQRQYREFSCISHLVLIIIYMLNQSGTCIKLMNQYWPPIITVQILFKFSQFLPNFLTFVRPHPLFHVHTQLTCLLGFFLALIVSQKSLFFNYFNSFEEC